MVEEPYVEEISNYQSGGGGETAAYQTAYQAYQEEDEAYFAEDDNGAWMIENVRLKRKWLHGSLNRPSMLRSVALRTWT